MQTLLRYFVRPAKQKSDILSLTFAVLVGGGAGLLMTEKFHSVSAFRSSCSRHSCCTLPGPRQRKKIRTLNGGLL